MGAWGYEPFDNDTALDWLHPIEDCAAKHIEAALRAIKSLPAKSRGFGRGDGYHEALAAAALLLELSTRRATICICYHATQKTNLYAWAVLAVEIIQRDAKWIADWKDPLKVTGMLRRLHRRLILRATLERKRAEKIRIRIVQRRVRYQGKHKRRAA